MSVTYYLKQILNELTTNQQYIDNGTLQELVTAIRQAGHIFTAGAGRSGIAISGFTNRLMHLGFSVSQVGEISSPHSHAGDLLIIGSGSGETTSLVALAEKAHKSNVKIALITMDSASSIARLADTIVVLPGVSPKLKNKGLDITSIQPMGSAFEQISNLTYDAIVMELMEQTGQTSDEMFTRHADFE